MSGYDSSYAPPPAPLIPGDANLSNIEFTKPVVIKGSVTQTPAITDAVTLNTSAGKITTVSSTLAGGAETAFTLNNTYIAADSVIIVKVVDYSGSQGIPLARVNAVAEGSCSIYLQNSHSTDALNGIAIIEFLVV